MKVDLVIIDKLPTLCYHIRRPKTKHMKTFTTILLTVFCLFTSRATAQTGSIRSLLEKNGFEWQSSLAQPSDFDNESDLGAQTEVTKLKREEDEKVTTTGVLSLIDTLNFTPLSLKESLQYREDTYIPDIIDVYHERTVVFFGSSVQVRGKTYYPILRWQEGSKKGIVTMTDNPFCCKEEVDIVVKH